MKQDERRRTHLYRPSSAVLEFRAGAQEAERRTFDERQARWKDYLQHNLPWVALILLSAAIIIHRFSAAVADCCSCFKGPGSSRTAAPAPEVEMSRMRQLEFDLVEARAQLHMARDWPSPPGRRELREEAEKGLQSRALQVMEGPKLWTKPKAVARSVMQRVHAPYPNYMLTAHGERKTCPGQSIGIYRLVSDDSTATVETLEAGHRSSSMSRTTELDRSCSSQLVSRQPDAAVSPVWTAEDLADADFDWTIIDGKVLAIDGFIPAHPGGRLIWSAVGQEATDLFRAHHASKAAEVALEKCFVGHFSTQRPRKRLQEGDIGFRAELNKRVSHLLKKPMIPVAEATAVSMLLLFCFWAFLTYVEGWFWLNVLCSWFWWRHLDAALHSAVHGDFRYSPWLHHQLLRVYAEIFTMLSTCMNGASQVLEPPASKAKLLERCKDVASWWAEALLSPGYQGASFLFQPFWHALAALLLSRAVAKLVLLPFAEVQHFLMPDAPSHEDFVLQQLSTTANLRFTSAAARLLDFLMFHGDSLQVEHHLWPAMSFVQLQEASRTVKATCRELGLPYTEIGYFEAFLKAGGTLHQQVLEDELRYLAKPEAGMSRRAAELKKAEAMHGELHKEREDVFRALARALAPGLNARDLAAVTVHTAEQEDETVERPDGGGKSLQAEGYLGQVFEALRDRRPLPTAPVQWDRQDVVNCLRTLVGAWAPLRVELHDSLSGVEVFPQQKESRSQKKQKKKQKKHKEQPAEAEIELKLVFLPGCGELHGVVGQKCSKEQVQALKSKREELLEQCREDYCLLETFHGGQGRYSRAERSWWGMRCKIGREALLAALWVGSASASSEYLAALCPSETCNEMSHPLLDFDQDTRECVCRSHPCWDDNGQLHTCRGQSGFPYLAFFYNEKKELQCECSSFPHYSSLYISRDLCAGHRCLDPAHPVLDYDDAKDECVCRSHPCWNDKGRSHKCDKPQFPILKFRHEEVNGRLKNVCECSISMEKDQSVPIMPFDKPGADPNEEEFEEDEERRLHFLEFASLFSHTRVRAWAWTSLAPRLQDRAIDLPEEGQIRFEHVEKALGQITWPNCFTRNNVKPDGAPFIEAFPLGIVLNYCLGLVCSRATRLWPTLTKLLAKFIQQEQPDFRYTTMQLNKNYATKMHVDANNHGPSFIIGLGDYKGGEVWIYDENGTVEMELPCTLRGWSHLRPGQKVPGRLEDCRNKWLKFDGNTPHMTMPYQGSRISIVYFTRKGWLTMLPETKDTLETSGFMLPGEDYQSLCTTKEDPQAQAKKVAKAPRNMVAAQEQIAIDSDDEVDEDEQVDEVLRAEQDSAAWPSGEWARSLRRLLYDSSCKLVDDAHELSVTICGNATCAGIALQEFLSEVAPFTISSAHVSGASGPLRLLKRTCKPQHVFCDLNAALAGSGHCEVQHKACKSTRTENQDFLFASFPCEPFLNLDPSKPSCFDDPKSATFLSVRSHLGLRQPRGCLLHCEGWHLLPEASRPSVYSFLMEGEDPRNSEDRQVDWGLSRLQNYGAAFVELPLMKFGVPLAGPDAFIILIRADCGGREAADAAAKLMHAIGELKLPGERKLLPSCTVGALMLPEEDPRVVNGVREAKQLEKAERAAGGRRKAPKSNTRQLTVEARELGLQPGDARYTEFLRGSKPPRDKWLKQAAPDKVVVLNLIYERCRQSGQDISNLCADLSQGFQPIGRRDDGLLPRPSQVSKATTDRPEYYAFSHHRALVGQEILLCHGYPIWRMDFRGLSEAEVLQLAAGSPAVPAVGAGIAAIFAVLDLGLGRNLKLPKSRLHELVKDFVEPAAQASLTAPSTETAELRISATCIPSRRPMAPKKRPAAVAVTAAVKRPATAKIAAKKPASRQDSVSCPHSVANFWEALVTSLELHLKVDFQRQLFSGECKLVVDKLKPGVCDVVLDVLDLAIHSITDEDGEPVGWRVETPDGSKAKFGKALFVTLPPGTRSKICVRYETTEKSTAIQWLTREQTTGKKHPLCFTQSQAICGRSLLPCQDTPSVKATFSISVTVPAPLMAVASGEPVGEPTEADGLRTFTYAQKVPVMSYLIAVIVAEFESRVIGKRSRCYAEPAIMEAARQEFSEIVDEFLETAQRVIGGAEYEWGSYNMAVLPSSFAYGGMENPNCTFLSASLIPGDRSLTTTLAHEIVHSWIGNLVTNAYWKDFWLNEGFTRYIERRILGNIHGAAFRGLLLLVGYNDLVKTVDMLNKQGSSGLTRLEPDIDDIDPDDAFSRVPYEKGSLFLFYLEQLVGGEEPMTKYLQSYIQKFRGRSIQTSDMKAHFIEFFKGVGELKQVDWELWLHGEGIPDFDLTAHVDKTLLEESRQAANRWLVETPQDLQIMSLKAQQVMLILDHLINALADGQSLSHEKLAAMDGQYNLSGTRNVEIGFRWCLLGCRCKWPGCLPATESFLASHGRGVYVKPPGTCCCGEFVCFCERDREKRQRERERERASERRNGDMGT
ncbi:lkhA [Symbiodinium necroappetens]|uniref:LkhA protein n=1 Tax=Symbiodinium necroappetens TaxID=1628268 RepID=A0A813C0B7_9DINO|nr:lkhA [Symbiodinium necroappetens]